MSNIKVDGLLTWFTEICFYLKLKQKLIVWIGLFKNTIILFVVPPKFCISILINFSWDLISPKTNWKKKACAKFGGNNEEYYGIFEKGLLTANLVTKPRLFQRGRRRSVAVQTLFVWKKNRLKKVFLWEYFLWFVSYISNRYILKCLSHLVSQGFSLAQSRVGQCFPSLQSHQDRRHLLKFQSLRSCYHGLP